MSDKVKMFLYITACVIIYVVLIPFQSYRLGYGKGYESGLDAGVSIGYGIAIDTITDILDTEITAGGDSTLTHIIFNDTVVYDLYFDPNKFSIKNDSITSNLK